METHPFYLVHVATHAMDGLLGNPAAVILTPGLPSEGRMRELARDLNQPATTFMAIEKEPAEVRWYAPDGQIGLCGHGSLGAAAVLQKMGIPSLDLDYGQGIINLSAEDNRFTIRLDAIHSEEELIPKGLEEAIGADIISRHANSNKHILTVSDESVVRGLRPDFAALRGFETFGWIVTAPGDHVDFVSRTFVPFVNALEDAATGSSHAALTPFWSDRLGKKDMSAQQLSERGGHFDCRLEGGTVQLLADCQVYAEGVIHL